jgi:hypothetical protein
MEERTAAPVMVNLSALEELYRSDIACTFLGDLVKALFSQTNADLRKLEFTQFSAAQRYLQASLTGFLLDTFRANTRPEELQQGDDIVGRQLWERIQLLFPDIREQRVAFLLFHCNLSPSDILRYTPQEFRDKLEICQLRRDMLNRILHHSDLTR